MSYRDRTTGEALLTYDEDNPCPHCGRREVERVGRDGSCAHVSDRPPHPCGERSRRDA